MRTARNFLYAALSALIVSVMIVAFSGCAMFQANPDNPINPNDLVLQAVASTIGGELGIIASTNPDLRARIENYYSKLTSGPIDISLANAALSFMKDQSPALRLLAGNIVTLITQLGVTMDPDGKITAITDKIKPYVEIGKQSYLLQLSIAGIK